MSSSPSLLAAWGGRKALTPPSSPAQPQRKRTVSSPSLYEPDATALDMLDLSATQSAKADLNDGVAAAPQIQLEPKEDKWKKTTPRPYLKRYELLGSVRTGFDEYGLGAWSTVFRAIECHPGKTAAPLTPPLSPPSSPKQTGINRLLAVKSPSRNDAHPILQQEARILTYLHSFPEATTYLVPFHGYDEPLHSLIFSAVPLNLESYVKQAARTARSNPSTKTMFDPVVGTGEWAHLAEHLISGLAFLHSHNCIHGDIKPANILLLQSSSNESVNTPLFCDFSSSRVIVPSTTSPGSEEDDDDVEEVTAVTPDYTSPELLVGLHGRTPGMRAVVTPASDVFSLGVTLLFAAIGESPYASARMEVQKLAMAREGRPVDFARSGEGAARVKVGKLVERIVKMGVEKDVKKRVDATEWLARTEDLVVEEKKRKSGG